MDSRGVAPVVGKVLAVGLAVLYIGATTTLLLGGVVPEYRETTGEELGERVLATAGGTIERALSDADCTVDVRVRAALPGTIKDTPYSLELSDGILHLDHQRDTLDARSRVELPPGVSVLNGTWRSGGTLVVHVSGPPGNRTLSLEGST